MGEHLTICERCNAIVATGREYADHMDYHHRKDKKKELEDMPVHLLRRVVEGIVSDDIWDNWCPVCHEHSNSHAKGCALVEATEYLVIRKT